eukprot:TRINITY_DN4723_c0_g1_i13.p1 TRINITY_DN4723_c0_g1~~TRINITY_DN4723_c0_g1_i13.p1  ORF type:complete len:147 (+),score=13.98 TRINITY_DN4723_c0_g1_i13:679-1119(+)
MGEFFSRDRLMVPKIAEIPSRLTRNLNYFQSNYILVFCILSLYSALTSPTFLLALGVVVFLWTSAMRWRTEPLVVNGVAVPEKISTLGLIFVTAFLLYISSIGAIFFWLITVSLPFVLGHALLYAPNPVEEFGFGSVSYTTNPFQI